VLCSMTAKAKYLVLKFQQVVDLFHVEDEWPLRAGRCGSRRWCGRVEGWLAATGGAVESRQPVPEG